MTENWRDVPGYEGQYQCSDQGRLKSLERQYPHFGKTRTVKEKIMRLRQSNDGYYRVKFYKNSKQKTYYLHRIIAISFLGEQDLDVNHLNGDKSDNRLINLEYCTRSENHQHAWDNGLKKVTKKMRDNMRKNRKSRFKKEKQ